jgi:hypothetical protein
MSLRGTFPSLGDKLPEFFDHVLLVVNPSPQFRGLRFEFSLDSLQLVIVVYRGSHESAFQSLDLLLEVRYSSPLVFFNPEERRTCRAYSKAFL